MKLSDAQSKANKAKSELIDILNDMDIKSSNDQRMHDQLENIIIKLEVWQNK